MLPGVSKGFNINTKCIVKASKYRKCIFTAASANCDKITGKHKLEDGTPDDTRKGTVMAYFITPLVDMESEDKEALGADTRIKKRTKVRYAVKLDSPELIKEDTGDEIYLVCGHGDLEPDMDELVLDAVNSALGGGDEGGIPNPFAEPTPPTILEASDDMKKFFGMDDANKGANSIVRAFKESGGRGIAGAITGLDFDWNLAPWDETIGKRAPTYVKVTMSFQPIHDIPLGLDAQGGIRAPAYPVGNVVRGLFGGHASQEALDAAKARVTAVVEAAAAAAQPEDEATPTPDGAN